MSSLRQSSGKSRKYADCSLMLLIGFFAVFAFSSVFSVSAYSLSTKQMSTNFDARLYPITLTSPSPQRGEEFGGSVSISGNLAIVGVYRETADGYTKAGHAYLYEVATGKLTQTLTSPNAQTHGRFGFSVAISGNLALVGAYGENASGYDYAGHAYVYNSNSGKLVEMLTSPDPQNVGLFGESVAISGSLAIVGAPGETANGYSSAGHAYVFNVTSDKLIQTLASKYAQTVGEFGAKVAIDGNTAIVAAPFEDDSAGHAYIFDASSGKLVQTLSSPNSQSGGEFGASDAIKGNIAVVGAPLETAEGQLGAGRAYEFFVSNGSLVQTFTSPNPELGGEFGIAVSISGNLVAVGGSLQNAAGYREAGHVYLFNAITGELTLTLTSPKAKDYGQFGSAVSMSGLLIVVGAPGESFNGFVAAGHAYLFKI